MSEQQYPGSSWRTRSIALAIILPLHAALLAISINPRTDAPIDPKSVVRVLEIPIEAPKPEPSHVVEPKLLAPPPPQAPSPELSIEETQVAAPSDNRLLLAMVPSAADSGEGRQSSGGAGGDGNGSGESIFTKCTNRVMPVYPSDAKRRGEFGRVTLLVELDEHGKLTVVSIARSSGSKTLDAAGIAAIKRWKCSPVFENGRATRLTAKQVFEFSIDDRPKTRPQ